MVSLTSTTSTKKRRLHQWKRLILYSAISLSFACSGKETGPRESPGDTSTDGIDDTLTDRPSASNPDSHSSADTDPETGGDADTDTDTDTDVNADTDTDVDADADTGGDTATFTESSWDTVAATDESDSDPETDFLDDSETGTGPDTSDSDTGKDAGAADAGASSCPGTFEVTGRISKGIATVGIVEWTYSDSVSSATIEFGRLGTEYVAPVDVAAPNYRTLLLGMKTRSTYRYRIVIDGQCESEDYIIETGGFPGDLPTIDAEPSPSDEFIIMSSSGYALIVDKDGDVVWYKDMELRDGIRFPRALMSQDGRYMWAGNLNLQGGNSLLKYTPMDGEGILSVLDTDVSDRHHDFCIAPGNRIATIEYDRDGPLCDRIVEIDMNGDKELIYTLRDDFGELAPALDEEWCHSNAIHYVPWEDAYYLSVLTQNMIVKVDRATRGLVWAMDGDGDTADDVPYLQTGVEWKYQHGHHTLPDGNLVMFNNVGETIHSFVRHFDIDGTTAPQDWYYFGESITRVLGDVQQLSQGNLLISYATNTLIHEVAPDRSEGGEVLRIIRMDDTASYISARTSLYGEPDRW